MSENNHWPVKTRDLHNHHMDSTIWDEFVFRDDDIIIGTYAKAGTTWTQQIVGQLIFRGDPAVEVGMLSHWLDLRVIPSEITLDMLDQQTHRRILKTHLPADALVYSATAKYLYVARDLPDVVWSLHNHLFNATDEFFAMFNDTPGRVGPALERPGPDIHAFWYQFLRNDGSPMWSFWENLRTWWTWRNLPNVRLVHFNDLKRDLEGEIRAIAAFLQIPIEESHWAAMVEHCSFDWMKAHAGIVTPGGGEVFKGGAQTFIHKGTNKRWKDVLNAADLKEYRTLAETQLGTECLAWLENGKEG